MADNNELSGFTIIIGVAVGIMAFILLFIFAKRQIMRFALKTRRGPHCPIGMDAHRNLKREIDRRLEAVKWIKFEPKLLTPLSDELDSTNESKNFEHVYRMKALDNLSLLEECIVQSCNDASKHRPSGQDLRFYLMKMVKDGGPLQGCETKLIHQFVDAYVHARHEPVPPFTQEDYSNYMILLKRLRNYVIEKNNLRNVGDPLTTTYNAKDTQVAINGKTRIRLIKQDHEGLGPEVESETSV